jgi:hypothetical protein
MPRLLSLGPFNLTAVGQQFLIMDPAQIGGGPDQVGQVAIYNYSSFLVGITSTTDGAQLDLQPGTAMVYDPPSRGGQLVGTVKSGSASTASSVVTAQVALDGARIEGAWPQTLSSVALQSNVPVNAGALQGVPIATTTPSTNQVLEFNGNDWAPATLPSSAFSLIQSQSTASGATTAITFSNIPQTYSTLVLIAELASTTSGTDYPLFRFNGDSGGDYTIMGYVLNGSSTLSGIYQTAFSAVTTALSNIPSNGQALPYELHIPGYARVAPHVAFLENAWATSATKIYGYWNPSTAAAITSITITLNSGSKFGASTASLYGLA